MKILYFSNAVIPTEASRSLSIMRVCQAFADAGHTVKLIALSPAKKHEYPVSYYGLRGGFEVQTDYFPSFLNNKYTQWYLIAGLIHAYKNRHIYKNFKPDLIYSRIAVSELFFAPSDVPIVYEMHSLGALGFKWWHKMAFRWLVKHKQLRRIVVTTDLLADMLKKELPYTEIIVARLSAEPPVDIDDQSLTEFRDKNLQGNFEYNVGYTGYLDTDGLRGTDIICQAAARMPHVGFHIVGGEPKIVEHWQKYAYDLNNHKNIFFYGYRNPAEIPYFLKIFDVVLAPLQFKPHKRAPTGQNMSPLKLPQYMGYGKAIVASDLHAHREVLSDGETALLVPHADVDAWISAIQSFLDAPGIRATFGQNAINVYKSEYTPSQRIKKILDELDCSAQDNPT